MKLTRRSLIGSAALAAAMPRRAAAAMEPHYPSRPIKVIVPFPAGGEADYLPRMLGPYFAEAHNSSFVIDNRSGGGGTIGWDACAKAAPDGYTVAIVSPGFTVNPSLMKTVPYDTLADLTPITRLATNPHVLIVHPSLPVNSVADLEKLVKTRNNMSFASVGVGSINQVEGEVLKRRWGADIVHVPYRGTAPALTDMLGNNATFMFVSLPSLQPLLRSGQLKALAVSTRVRHPLLPDVPTMVESGYPEFVFDSWFGMVAPRQTSSDIVAKLNSEMRRILALPEAIAKLEEQAFTAAGETPESFGAFLSNEVTKFTKLIPEIGIPRQ